MAAIFQCFRRKSKGNSHEIKDKKCKCKKIDKVLQCGHCNSTLHGYWERSDVEGADGGSCSKKLVTGRDSKELSVNGDSASDGNSPTNRTPPRLINGNSNTGFYLNDYRPSVQGNISGMSYMPVSKNDPNYNMGHSRRGKAVIFNFAQWNNTNIPTMELEPRRGSEKDKLDLVNCLKNLSFEVVCYDNLKRQEYDKAIDDLRREDHRDADCLLVAVMTHGEKNSIYLSDGSLIPVNSVWEEFEAHACPTLAGKPKIFIIQACRGDRYDHGTRLLTGGGQSLSFQNDVTDSGTFSYVIPNAADIIVAFSCPLGHYSWRHPERGSWFIQSLCQVFNRSAYEMELQSLLTTVAREVAVNYESSTNQYDSDKKKQVPSTSSTLIRNVYFNRKPSSTVSTQILNEDTIENLNHTQANGRHISLQEVQEALASAQTSVSENLLAEAISSNVPEIVPVVSVFDGVVEPQIGTRNTTVELIDGASSDLGDIQTETVDNEVNLPAP